MLAAIGALLLGGGAIYVFYKGRAAVLAPDAARGSDRSLDIPDAPLGAGVVPDVAPPPDAAPADAPDPRDTPDADDRVIPPTTRDAREPRDARDPRPAPHDDGPRPAHPDAREPGELTVRVDAGSHPAAATGTATLTIGAIPWGTVLLDGKPIGRTPIDHLSVPAGHHVISVTFSGDDPARTLSYTVDLATGESKDLVADFTQR
jgi:hypothetical protein